MAYFMFDRYQGACKNCSDRCTLCLTTPGTGDAVSWTCWSYHSGQGKPSAPSLALDSLDIMPHWWGRGHHALVAFVMYGVRSFMSVHSRFGLITVVLRYVKVVGWEKRPLSSFQDNLRIESLYRQEFWCSSCQDFNLHTLCDNWASCIGHICYMWMPVVTFFVDSGCSV